jgi:hypothetical protein
MTVKSEATPMHRHDGVLRVDRDPYPHLRDDSGVVLARDYEQVEVMAFVCHAANSHSALLAHLEQRDTAITEACARLKALESQRDALAKALENATYRVEWLRQFASIEPTSIESEIAEWRAALAGATKEDVT